MCKYEMYTRQSDLLGQGTSSLCWRGLNTKTGQEVAIKVYKKVRSSDQKVLENKFIRQIRVLQELQVAATESTSGAFWHPQLEVARPSKLFMNLIDYSKDAAGAPGKDATDGVMYVVTELGHYSLKDYLKTRRDTGQPLPRETVRTIAKSIVLAVGTLHAKGLVHLDLKPENLMMFDGCLKLIDVDGCMECGATVSVDDFSLSFTPCYCAPEWARFLVHPDESTIVVEPHLDVWSVGITICELVLLDPVLRPMFVSFLRHGRTHRQAGFLFMDWLSKISEYDLPDAIAKFDAEIADLLRKLLNCDKAERLGLPAALSHAYLARAALRKARTFGASGSSTPTNLTPAAAERASTTPRGAEHLSAAAEPEMAGGDDVLPARAPRHLRPMLEDSSNMVMHKGTLYKLKSAGNPADANDWLKRDVWITSAGSLSYLSQKEQKRLVMLDGHSFSQAQVEMYTGSAVFKQAFQIRMEPEQEGEGEQEGDGYVFGCESSLELRKWMEQIEKVRSTVLSTLQLDGDIVQDLRRFKLSVKNRRQKLSAEGKEPASDVAFRSKLWKVKSEGDRMQLEDWVERNMWLSSDGSLIYWSKKEERQLMYYTSDDVQRAELACISHTESALPWAFSVRLPAVDGVEFDAGEFAAESEAMREKWMQQFVHFGAASATAA